MVVSEKLIHSLKKNEHALDIDSSLHDNLGEIDEHVIDGAPVKKRTNVLLLCDHMGVRCFNWCFRY